MGNLRIWQTAFILFGLCFLTVGASAQESRDFKRYEDPALEKEIDNYLASSAQGHAKHETLAAIVEGLTAETPALTYTRAVGYYILEVLYEGADDPENEVWQVANDLIAYAERSGVIDAIVDAQGVLISLYYHIEDDETGFILLQQALPNFDHLSSPRVRYFVNNLAGRVLRSLGDYEQALTHYIIAAEAIRETDDILTNRRRIYVTEGIGRLRTDLGHFEEGLESARYAIEIAEKEKFEAVLARLYLFKGYLEGRLDQNEASLISNEKAMYWAKKYNQNEIQVIAMNNIGSSLMEKDKFEEAEAILKEAREVAIGNDDPRAIELIKFNLSYIQAIQSSTNENIQAMEQAAELFRETSADEEYSQIFKYFIRVYKKAGLYEKAITALEEQQALFEKMAAQERSKVIEEMQTRFRANEQAAEIQLLEQKNAVQQGHLEQARLQKQIFFLLGIVIILGGIVLLFAWRTARQANLKLASANLKLQYQSSHDPLTGLLNRRSFQSKMTKRQRKSDQRNEAAFPDALLLLDIDYFKKINDKSGHAAGDSVLVEVGRRLKQVSRDTDLVVRWGGEEFLLYLQEMDPEHLPEFTERVLEAVGGTPIQSGHQMRIVTATAGFIPYPFDEVDEAVLNWERCLQIADMALYIGKVQGRNQGVGIMGLKVPYEDAKHALENDLTGAIEKEWVEVSRVPGPR